MRTDINSFSRTCPECGTRNRLHVFTTGYSPSWRVACSKCIAVIIDPQAKHRVWSFDGASDPIANVTLVSRERDKARKARRAGLPGWRAGGSKAGGRGWRPHPAGYAAAGFLAGCSLALALLVGGKDVAGPDLIEAASPQQEMLAAALPAEADADVPASAEAAPDEIRMAEAPASEAEVPAPADAKTAEATEAASAETYIAEIDTAETETAETHLAEAPVEEDRRMPGDLPLPGMSLHASLDGTPNIPREISPAGHQAPHPASGMRDPRESIAALQESVFQDPVAAAASEAALELSRAERQSIQRRLLLAKHDTRGVDGIFGSATRAAIASWQREVGLAPTGYATRSTFDRLVAETDTAYRAWHRAENARRNATQLASAVPVPRPEANADPSACPRLPNGEIAYGQSFACDVKGLGENLRSIRRNFAQGFDPASTSRLRGRTPGDA